MNYRPLCLLVLAGWGAVGRGATPPPAAGPEVIKMSPYEVSAMSVDFKRWIKVGSPNFIVYTDASPKEASSVLRELEMLHAAAQRFFGRKAIKLGQRRLVLPTVSSDWRKLRSQGSVEWKVAVSNDGEAIADLIVVQYDWQDEGIWIVRAAQGRGELRRANFDAPFWYQRGIGKFFETAEFGKDAVMLGRENPRTAQLEHAAWVPWQRFFEVDAKSPEFVKEGKVRVFDAQSALVVQYIFTHEKDEWRQRLNAWLTFLNAGWPPKEADFKTTFTLDFKDWNKEMNRYREGGNYRLYTVPLPPETTRFEETKYPLPVREMRDLFVLTQILTQNVPASDVSLDAVLAKGLETEALREVLASACIERKRPEAALAELRKLIAAGSTNPSVYFEAAKLRPGPDKKEEEKPSLDDRLGPEVTEMRAWLRKALELEPRHAEAAQMLAWVEAMAPEVDPQSVVTIERLYLRLKLLVSADDLIMPLAVALWRSGDEATARTLAEKVQAERVGTKGARELAAMLLERLKTPAK